MHQIKMKVYKNKFLYTATFLVSIVLGALIFSGLLVPLYSDEISLKMMQAAAISNGGKLLALTPQCNSGLTLPIPTSWYPAAIVYQLVFQGLSPLMIRVSGIVVALLFIFTTAMGIRRIALDRNLSQYIILVFLTSVGVGLIPLTLILSRSEQWLLLCLSCLILPPLFYKNKKHGDRVGWLLLVAYVVCASLFFYTHPKSLFFSPVVIASGWIFFRGNRVLQACAIVFSILCSVETFVMAKEISNCLNAPFLASMNASQTLNFSGLIHQPTLLFKLFYTYLSTFPDKAIQYSVFRNDYFASWLPPLLTGKSLTALAIFVNKLIYYFIYVLFFAGLLLPVASILIAFFRKTLGSLHLMLAMLWLSAFAHLILYVNWNFYAASLIICVLIILVLLSVIDIPWPKHGWILGYLISFVILGLFMLSAFVNFTMLTPSFLESMNLSKDFNVYGQPSSILTFHFSERRDRVRKLAFGCGIGGDGSTHLVVDNLTYFAFDNLHEPLHLAYISEKGSGQDIKDNDFIPFLHGMNSPGIIGRCSLFPNSVRPIASEVDGICCLGFAR